MEINPTSNQLAPVSTTTPEHSPATTPNTTGVKFAQAMGSAVTVAGQMAATVSSGGALGAGPLAASIGSSLNGGGVGGLGGSGDSASTLNSLLQQQEALQLESEEFTSLTNISKTEHDTKMSAVHNLSVQS